MVRRAIGADQHHLAILARGEVDLAGPRLDDHHEVHLSAVANRDADSLLHPETLRRRTGVALNPRVRSYRPAEMAVKESVGHSSRVRSGRRFPTARPGRSGA